LNITKNGIHVQDESLRDTLIDLHNYAAMALMESESEPTVPNLPKTSDSNKTYGSEPPSEPVKVSNIRTLESFRDKVLPKVPDRLLSLSAERACIDQCINLR
jgi:hypothetical protein